MKDALLATTGKIAFTGVPWLDGDVPDAIASCTSWRILKECFAVHPGNGAAISSPPC